MLDAVFAAALVIEVSLVLDDVNDDVVDSDDVDAFVATGVASEVVVGIFLSTNNPIHFAVISIQSN